MEFTPISITDYIGLLLKDKPDLDVNNFRNRLIKALNCYKKGIKCSCGNDIWVIGSATTWNSCFLCLTGENPADDYEIDEAVYKTILNTDPSVGRKGKFFYDDETEHNPDLYPKPGLCLTCFYAEHPDEEYLCVLNRMGNNGSGDFECGMYLKL